MLTHRKVIARNHAQPTFYDQKLEDIFENKYLGVTVCTDLSWSSHIANVVEKCSRLVNIMRCASMISITWNKFSNY